MSTVEYSLRFLWFIVVGWWLAGLWLCAALLACLTVVGMPVAYGMMDYLGGIAFGPDF